MSNIPQFSIKELLEAGVHFGHKTMRWNPKMSPYIYGENNGIHIIDLQKTAPMLHKALCILYEIAKNNGRILFVGTKRQASEIVAESAKRCGQYYVNHRWLGGMLTNWSTISKSINTLENLESKRDSKDAEFLAQITKKEMLDIEKKSEKLERSLGGIREMGGKPDLLFVIDTNRENIAILEAKKLGIPVVGIVDTNSDPESVNYPIAGNDDAARSIKLYCRLVSDAILSGIQESFAQNGGDIGENDKIISDKNNTSNVKKKKNPSKTLSLDGKKVNLDAIDKESSTDNRRDEAIKKTPALSAKGKA